MHRDTNRSQTVKYYVSGAVNLVGTRTALLMFKQGEKEAMGEEATHKVAVVLGVLGPGPSSTTILKQIQS
jgi:hypothetical protein